MGITTQISSDGAQMTIKLPASFDIGVSKEFRNIKNSAATGLKKFVIDFSQTEHMDSSALGMLLLLREELGGDTVNIELHHCSETIRELLKLARFDDLFTII
ncbi:anti-sigma factor antagonist [Ectothiorhodospiraceae bacterium BW-2]|nr:anti-sigma factor antagonist [Ectothiorhodospiraceae bacterium BW-2]